MNPIELALEKQRLQLAAAAQRAALAGQAEGLQPLFDAADRVRAGVRWLGHHPAVVAGGVAVFAAVRPGARCFIWRWGRRSFVAWRFWRDVAARRVAPMRS